MTMEVLPDCAHASADIPSSNLKPMESCAQQSSPVSSTPICVGCNRPILDQFVMKVQPSLSWHSACLKCAECNRLLDETCTCYIRDGKSYCKADFHRLFVCSKCGNPFRSDDMVMKADPHTYHTDCFRCTACSRLLTTGDHIAVREGGLYCREDNEVLERSLASENERDDLLCLNNNNNQKLHHPDKRTSMMHDNMCQTKLKRSKDGKPTRVRTVLSEKQLHTLRTCYTANPRPDALMKEQLVEMTGLSARVIRVWFQNKRCKDKKKSMMLKHIQQQDKSLPSGMQGVAVVAHSPLRHDNGLKTIDSYHHQSWKHIPDYGPSQQEEINHNSFPSSLMSSLYGSSDESAVYINEEDYMDCMQPDSVSSQFSGASTSPHSSA